MIGYYDYILGLIPTALLGITAVLLVAGLPLTVAVPGGASVSALLVGHALFVNGPVDRVVESGTPSQSVLAE